MSRTDVHTPMWVKKAQPEWRAFFIEWHDHTQHPCNFDIKNESYRDCLLSANYQGRNIHCGCHMCTGWIGRRAGRRFERQMVKRKLRKGFGEDGFPKLASRY